MNPLPLLLPVIKAFEGLRLAAYKCPAGIWTIGYGATGPGIVSGTMWTAMQAEERLVFDANKYLLCALKLSPILARFPHAHAAIADFIYNLGPGRYSASTLKKRVDSMAFSEVRTELSKWVMGGGKKLPGLILRRNFEADLFERDLCRKEKRVA